MSKETHREFWIYDSGTRDKPVWEYEPEDSKECIHVIEYAAYEKLKAKDLCACDETSARHCQYHQALADLQKENEELKKLIEAKDCVYQVVVEENASLRERIKEAYDALDTAMTVWQTDWKCATCVELNEACYYKLSNAFDKIKAKGEL